MSVSKEENFDIMLSQALRERSEPVPVDFTDRISRQIKEAEEQRILARVVMEERLALAGCIVLGIMAIVSLVVFPGVAVSFKELVETSVRKITQAVEIVHYEWQLYTAFAGIFGFAVYSLVDLLATDSWR